MRWELTEEQADFRSVLADWLAAHCAVDALRPRLDAGDLGTFEDRFAAEGWPAVGAPEEFGGQGGGLVELALTAEELGRRSAPSSDWLGSMLALPGLRAVPEAAKALLADGTRSVLAVPADAVPGGPSGVISIDGVLSGVVPTVLGAGRARRLLVPVGSPEGTSLVLVDTDQDGLVLVDRELTDRTRAVADVRFDRAVGTPVGDDGSPVASAALREAALRGAVLVAADALGAMERMLDLTVSYVGQRRQFGVPIGSFQAVKHAAAEMLVKVEAARSIVYLAAASVEDARDDAPLHAAAAKAQVTGAASAAADDALTLHGAIGYTWEHELQLPYKRAKLDAPLLGSPAVWNERLAEALELAP